MGHSSLLGIERAPAQPAGTDNAALGPSDNSDSGSDRVGIADGEASDPGWPVDVAVGDDQPRSLQPEPVAGSDSDGAGTGERRSAGGDAGAREAADIGVDRIVRPHRRAAGDGDPSDDEDADLGFIDEVQVGDMLDEEDIDGDGAGPDPDAGTGAAQAPAHQRRSGHGPAAATPQPPPPTRPNPEPDLPEPGDDGELPDEADEAEDQRPGRA